MKKQLSVESCAHKTLGQNSRWGGEVLKQIKGEPPPQYLRAYDVKIFITVTFSTKKKGLAFYANYVPYIGIKLFCSLSARTVQLLNTWTGEDTNTQTHMDSVHCTHTLLNITRRHLC